MRDLDRQMTTLREQQAAAWVSKLEKPDSGQYAEFVAWLKESPLNVREYLMATSIEHSLDQLDAAHRYDVDELLKQFDGNVARLHAGDRTTIAEPAKTKETHRWRHAVAAVLALIAVSGGWLYRSQTAWREYQTGIGEQRVLQLDDGSVVSLNAHSHVAVRFAGNLRDVKLIEGEALFKVHHDAQRPFRVFARDAVIRDIGTQFNVYSRSDSTKVAVVEGIVEVIAQPDALAATRFGSASAPQAHATSRTLIANQQAQVSNDGSVTVSTTKNVVELVAWQQRRLVFRDESLSHIADTFNQYNHRLIRVDGDELKARRYSGAFDADDPDSLAMVLADDPGVSVDKSSEEIVIRSNRR